MKSIGHKKVISQCLSMLPSEEFSCPLFNYGKEKLSTEALMKIFVVAQFNRWESYKEIETRLKAEPAFQKALGLSSISGSQLSRRINELPTKYTQQLFMRAVSLLQNATKDSKGINEVVGALRVIDSTHLKLPPTLCDWAFVSKGWNVVKMHTRIDVVSEDVCFPDMMIPSTGNVSDFECTKPFIEKSNHTYLMDRGYPSKGNLMHWQKEEIKFVARISNSLKVIPIESYEVTHPAVLKDEKVLFGVSEEPIRLIEFKDEEEKVYRLFTTRWDLSSEQVMDVYRYRWKIETFFRWIKQHTGIIKIWSTKPQGIWNQLYLALTAYCLSLLYYLETKPPKTTLWDFIVKLKAFMFTTIKSFRAHLFRKKKESKGRQKIPIPSIKKLDFQESIAIIKPRNKK